MKSKFALALDLLEQEVEVLSKEQQSQFFGGDDPYGSGGYESNGYDSNGSNGFCYFNTLAYVGNTMGCNTMDYNVDIPGMLTRGFRGKVTRQLAGER